MGTLLDTLLDLFGMWDYIWQQPDPGYGRPACVDAQA